MLPYLVARVYNKDILLIVVRPLIIETTYIYTQVAVWLGCLYMCISVSQAVIIYY